VWSMRSAPTACAESATRCQSIPVWRETQRGDVGDPHQALPKMFCAVNRDQHEFVFHRKGGSFMSIEAHADVPREKILEGEPARKIAQGEIVVQLDDEFQLRD